MHNPLLVGSLLAGWGEGVEGARRDEKDEGIVKGQGEGWGELVIGVLGLELLDGPMSLFLISCRY
jgi:hypothetical protein